MSKLLYCSPNKPTFIDVIIQTNKNHVNQKDNVKISE